MAYTAEPFNPYLKYGLGLNTSYITDVKTFAVGVQRPLVAVFDYQLETGVYSDVSQTQGLIGYTNACLGVSVNAQAGVYVKLFSGPALVTQTDTKLSGVFEFNHDFELGLRDNRGVSLGLDYKHMSNAGLYPNNVGRDFLMLKLQLPW